MTVASSTDRATFPGNGTTTVFSLPFRFFANSEIQAWLVTNATGALTALTLGTHYTLVGAGLPEVNGNAASVLTMITAPTSLQSLFVQRVIPATQATDIVNQGRFFPEIHEDVFDRLTMLIQQNSAGIKGAIRVPDTDPEPARLPTVTVRADKLLSFDASGNPIAVAAASQSATDLELRLANVTDSAKGAGLVGFIRSVVGAVGMKLSRWLGFQPITPLDFMTETQRISVLAYDATEDVTIPLQAFRDYLAGFSGKPPKAVIPAGLYKYSVSPNWAIDNLVVESKGSVFFRYTGTGNALIFDAGAATGAIYNVDFGPVFIEAPSTAGHGVFVRSVHHSHIKAIVRGCGTTKHALQANFAVATTFEVIASVNQNFRIPGTPVSGWYLDAKPLHGLYLDQRGAGEQVSACYFPKPIIEGVADTGILLVNAIMNRFVGGTSEANGNINIVLEATASENTFDGIDLEVAASTVGLIDKGDRNAFNEILNSDLTQIQATANSSRFTGGIFNGISDSGTGTKLLDLSYSSNGGVISELGTGQERMRCFNLTGATFDDNKLNTLKIKLGATIKKHLSATAGLGFVAPPVPGFTAAQVVSVPGAALGDTVVVSCSVAGSSLQFMDARVTATDSVSIMWGQLSGASTTPGVGGETYRVDVWGH